MEYLRRYVCRIFHPSMRLLQIVRAGNSPQHACISVVARLHMQETGLDGLVQRGLCRHGRAALGPAQHKEDRLDYRERRTDVRYQLLRLGGGRTHLQHLELQQLLAARRTYPQRLGHSWEVGGLHRLVERQTPQEFQTYVPQAQNGVMQSIIH